MAGICIPIPIHDSLCEETDHSSFFCDVAQELRPDVVALKPLVGGTLIIQESDLPLPASKLSDHWSVELRASGVVYAWFQRFSKYEVQMVYCDWMPHRRDAS